MKIFCDALPQICSLSNKPTNSVDLNLEKAIMPHKNGEIALLLTTIGLKYSK